MVGIDDFIVGHDNAVFDGGAEFADVSGPRVGDEEVEGGIGEGFEGALVFIREFLEEGVGEEDDVLRALAEGGHFDGDDVEAVVEVFPEAALIDHFAEVAVGGGDEADVNFDGGVGADAFDGAFGEGAEEFDLGGGVDFTDFVKEEGAAIGLFEAADAFLRGAGEGAFFVAEEFGFEELGGERGAVDDDEFGCGAAGEVVDGVGDDFLAGAGFALDEDGGAGGGDLFDEVGDAFDFRGFADDAGEAAAAFYLLGELGVFGFEGAGAEGAFEEHFDFVEVEGFGDEVEGAAAHGFDGGIDGAVGGHHEDERGVGELGGGIDEIHAGVAAEAEVGEEEVDLFVFEDEEGLGVVGGEVDVEIVFEGGAEAFAGGAFVVNDEESREHFLNFKFLIFKLQFWVSILGSCSGEIVLA